ncbi:MAG: imidazole glycerol phosphate synthase subunit HisF [Legionellaceae bacterium]|nr:imidazole glycerol phosphate synthase subunit HisF [Legionellaceae bacterium]
MIENRVIPVLLVQDNKLVKTVKFKRPVYIGEPINTAKIFNDKEVDELVVFDISASKPGSEINFQLISEFASECFMPLCYGGGVRTLSDIEHILKLGVEKVSLNTAAIVNDQLVEEAAKAFGSSTIVVTMDVKKDWRGRYRVYSRGKLTACLAEEYALSVQAKGAGELIINAVDRDGTMEGYDIELVKTITNRLSIPVVACGGAGSLQDFHDIFASGGVFAAGAGSVFIFHDKKRSVLINYPSQSELSRYVDLFSETE